MMNGFAAFVARCRRQKSYAELGLPRVSMAVTLYQIKEHIATVAAEMDAEKAKLTEMLADPVCDMKVVRDKKDRVAQLKERHDGLSEQAAEMEAEARRRAKPVGTTGTAEMSREEARGLFYRAVLNGQDVRALPQMAYEQLGAIPAGNVDQGSGSNLLPTNLSHELMLDPVVENPLQSFMTVTDVTGLEVPKLGFVVDDDDFFEKDGQTAKELKAKSDKITFGRFKLMLKAAVSETVLRSTPLNIEGAVTSALNSAQAAKLLKVIFAESPKPGETHMSFYSSQNAIKKVTGSRLLDAILAAYGDLEDVYVPNARVVMRRADYISMIRDLANGSDTLFGKKPEDVIGIPVVFCEKAKKPIVGDLKYLHLNYDIPPFYDTDKDVNTGNRLFVLTHWYDVRIRMSSAFRVVETTETP